jgi:hypothetical protein
MASKTLTYEETTKAKVRWSRENATYRFECLDWDTFDTKTPEQRCYISPVDWRTKYHDLRQEVDNRGYDFEDRISIPLLDWQEFSRFRKSWIYRLWRSMNG